MTLPSHPSETIRKLNPHIWRGVGNSIRPVEADQSKPTAPQTLDSRASKLKSGKAGLAICIGIIVLSRRGMDSDNLQGAAKPVRDGIAESLGLDDGDSRITWEYGWVKTSGQQGVLVKITV